MQPRLWGYTVSLPKNILMGLWLKGRLFLLVREGDLPAVRGAGRLGLQASPGGSLSALGFKSPG